MSLHAWQISKLIELNLQVEVSTLDVADEGETHQMMQLAAEMAPVAGVFHLAMRLTDKWIANQVPPPPPLSITSVLLCSVLLFRLGG